MDDRLLESFLSAEKTWLDYMGSHIRQYKGIRRVSTSLRLHNKLGIHNAIEGYLDVALENDYGVTLWIEANAVDGCWTVESSFLEYDTEGEHSLEVFPQEEVDTPRALYFSIHKALRRAVGIDRYLQNPLPSSSIDGFGAQATAGHVSMGTIPTMISAETMISQAFPSIISSLSSTSGITTDVTQAAFRVPTPDI